MAISRMRTIKDAIKPLFMAELPKFPRLAGNRDRGTGCWRQILNRKWKNGHFAHAHYKRRNKTHICGAIAEILASYRKSGSRNTMVTSNFRPEIEIWPFRACSVKIRNKTLIYGGIAEIPASYRKSRSRNTMVMSDFRPGVKIWPFRACAI